MRLLTFEHSAVVLVSADSLESSNCIAELLVEELISSVLYNGLSWVAPLHEHVLSELHVHVAEGYPELLGHIFVAFSIAQALLQHVHRYS